MRNLRTVFLAILFASILSIAAMRGQEQNNGKSKKNTVPQTLAEFESQYPIADYDAPEPADPKEREGEIRQRSTIRKAVTLTLIMILHM
jgi:hypothetical protein